VGRKELGCPLTGAREAVRRPGDSGKGGGGQNSDAEHAEAREWGNGGEDECGEWGGRAPCPFIWSEEERRSRASEGNGWRRWCTIME
jgi:hypothetical protein